MNKVQNFALFSLRAPLISLLIVLFNILITAQVSGQGLSFGGRFTKRIYFEGKTYDEPPVGFSITLRDGRWSTMFGTGNPGSGYNHAGALYNGTNLSLIVIIEGAVEAQREQGLKTATNTALGTLYRGEVPNLESADEVGVIWLAYASGSYFEKQTTALVEPAFNQDPNSAMRFGPPNHFKMKADWQLTESQPAFLKHLAYLSDGYAMNAKGKSVKRPAPYDKGFTNSYYQVQSFTNIDGLNVPLTSSFHVFREKPDATSNTDLDLLFEYNITLESVSTHADPIASEFWMPMTAVQDFRIKTDSKEQFACYITNRLPTDREVINMKVSGGKLIRDARAAHKTFVRNTLRIVLCVTLFMVPIVMLLKFRRIRT